jgi:hypothetical protein
MLKFYEHNVDLHTFILFCVFDRVWSSLERVSEFRARACSKDDMEHAKNTCPLLEWLGLVEPDSTSPFGYRPTRDPFTKSPEARLTAHCAHLAHRGVGLSPCAKTRCCK